MEKEEPDATEKLTEEEFVLRAIKMLHEPDKTKPWTQPAIHTVFSKFNECFRLYFGEGHCPIKTVKRLVEEGKISMKPAFRGVMIAGPGVFKPYKTAEQALRKMKLKHFEDRSED